MIRMDTHHTEKGKLFIFVDERGTSREELKIIIPEVIDPEYGMYVWPCAPVLAQFVWWHKSHITGKNVLELGAGTALPGVVAAKVGANVVLSDASHLPECMENGHHTFQANGIPTVPLIGITWGRFNDRLLQLTPPDIILGSDCFYDSKDFEDIIVTVSFLLRHNPRAQFWTTYQERSMERSIASLLEKWGLACVQISLDSFHGNTLTNSDIQMLVVTCR